jgi:CRISPR/Cas system-associated protein Csm6
MNRREKRLTSKRLGILQYQQKLPRNKKFELIRENIIAGKKRENEVAEEIRQQTNAYIEEKESQTILHLAEDIAKRKKIPIIDAMEEAKHDYFRL